MTSHLLKIFPINSTMVFAKDHLDILSFSELMWILSYTIKNMFNVLSQLYTEDIYIFKVDADEGEVILYNIYHALKVWCRIHEVEWHSL